MGRITNDTNPFIDEYVNDKTLASARIPKYEER